jgi:hypothetical protein
MIGKLKGVVDGVGEDHAIIDVHGVGYVVQCSSRTLQDLPASGEAVVLFIDTQVREDAIRLFGFRAEQEREWFRLLQSVQGVGAKVALAILSNAFEEETVTDEKGKSEVRTVLHFHPRIAPIKVGIFPLLKNKPELVAKAREIVALLRPHMSVFYDETGAIGRRYRRQDEVGTPFGVTIDFETLGEEKPELKDTVTLRERDSMQQRRIPIADLLPFLLGKIL